MVCITCNLFWLNFGSYKALLHHAIFCVLSKQFSRFTSSAWTYFKKSHLYPWLHLQLFSSNLLLRIKICIEKIKDLKAILCNFCRWFLVNAACCEFAIIVEEMSFSTIGISALRHVCNWPLFLEAILQSSFSSWSTKILVCSTSYLLARKIE